MTVKKNATLELLKLFAAYMVVFIHVMFYGKTGVVTDALARFAVPLFFLTSGYFSYNITPEKIKKRTKHIFNLILVSTVCYIIFGILTLLLSGNSGGIPAYLGEIFHPVMILRLIALNKPVSSGHLWYLWAMLYVYIVYYFATKRGIKEKTIFRASFILLALHLLLGEGLSVFNVTIPIMVIRNFALMGIPFFGLGLFVRKYQDKISEIPNYVLIPAVLIGIAETLLSTFFIGKNELYTGTLLIVFAMVVTFVKHPDLKHTCVLDKLDGCGTYIYIFHKMVSSFIISVYYLCGVDYYASSPTLVNVHPLIVCVATTALALIITQTKRLVGKKA